MAIMANDTGGGGDFSPVPMGTHFAVCDMVVDLGRQKISSPQFGDSVKHQIYLRWQIPAERVTWKDGDVEKEGPAVIGKTYTLSLGEKANLRKDLQAWRGRTFTADELRGFDVTCLAGIPAMVTVTHTEKDGRTYANIASLGGIPKGAEKPKLEGDAIVYDADNQASFERLSKRLQERVQAQILERAADPATGNPDPDGWRQELDDEVPF